MMNGELGVGAGGHARGRGLPRRAFGSPRACLVHGGHLQHDGRTAPLNDPGVFCRFHRRCRDLALRGGALLHPHSSRASGLRRGSSACCVRCRLPGHISKSHGKSGHPGREQCRKRGRCAGAPLGFPHRGGACDVLRLWHWRRGAGTSRLPRSNEKVRRRAERAHHGRRAGGWLRHASGASLACSPRLSAHRSLSTCLPATSGGPTKRRPDFPAAARREKGHEGPLRTHHTHKGAGHRCAAHAHACRISNGTRGRSQRMGTRLRHRL